MGLPTLIDVLYNLQNDIYGSGAGGAIESVINVLTTSVTVLLATCACTGDLDPC